MPALGPCSACRCATGDETGAGCGSAKRRCGGALLPVLLRFATAPGRRAKRQSSRLGPSRSKSDLRSIGGDLPARTLGYLALRGMVQQCRIGIVDMQKYLSGDVEAGKTSDRAGFA